MPVTASVSSPANAGDPGRVAPLWLQKFVCLLKRQCLRHLDGPQSRAMTCLGGSRDGLRHFSFTGTKAPSPFAAGSGSAAHAPPEQTIALTVS